MRINSARSLLAKLGTDGVGPTVIAPQCNDGVVSKTRRIQRIEHTANVGIGVRPADNRSLISSGDYWREVWLSAILWCSIYHWCQRMGWKLKLQILKCRSPKCPQRKSSLSHVCGTTTMKCFHINHLQRSAPYAIPSLQHGQRKKRWHWTLFTV